MDATDDTTSPFEPTRLDFAAIALVITGLIVMGVGLEWSTFPDIRVGGPVYWSGHLAESVGGSLLVGSLLMRTRRREGHGVAFVDDSLRVFRPLMWLALIGSVASIGWAVLKLTAS